MVMSSLQTRRKAKRSPAKQKKGQELPSTFNIKLFVSMGLLLVILLMKKYDLSIGDFNVDSIYTVMYHSEDIDAIRDKIFFFDNRESDDPSNLTTDNSTNASTETSSDTSTDDSTDAATQLSTETTTDVQDVSPNNTNPSEEATEASN